MIDEIMGRGSNKMAITDTKDNRGLIITGLMLVFVVVCQAANGDSCDFKKIGIWSNCGYSNTTSKECATLKCCYANDAFLVSKNLTQKCVQPPDSFEWRNGTCNKYNGTVCEPFLGNKTINRDIFFDLRYGVDGTESILRQFIHISDISVKESKLCRKLIPTGVCKMLLPQCGVDGRPELSCREDCDQIHRLCSKDIDRFYGALEFYVKQQQIDFSHLNIPTCTDFKYSYEYSKNDTCVFIGTMPCFNKLSANTGVVRPHVTYGKYLPNHNCTWQISVQEGFIVKLTFSVIDMEESAGCSNDYVIIRDGLLKNSPVLQRICGKSVPTTIESSSHQVSIQFITNSKEEAAGFIINYEKTSAKPKPSNDTTRIAIAAGVSAGLAIIALIAIIIWRSRSRAKRRELEQEEAKKDLEMFTTITTVRDRIRQDSMPNPLVEALARLTPDQKPPQCRLDRMEYVKDLGQGQFGKVFQGRYKLTENTDEVSVAVKMLKEGSSAETKDSFIQEVTLMSVLQHANILKLLAVSIEEEPFCMVFEFMSNGDLNQYLRNHDPENNEETNPEVLTNDILVDMARQIAKGMEYLSQKRFVHRDLATRNCLVGVENEVKIADFGMSRDVYESDYYKVGGAAMLPIRWMPPEALLYGRFTVESDVYSFGILLWEIFTFALQPFYGYSNDEVVKFIKKGVILPKPDICPPEIYDNVMTKCWYKDPERRLNFTEIYKRLDGDYSFSVEKVPKKPRKAKEVPAYSVPPSLIPEPKKSEEMKRIPSKKDSVGSSPQYVNYQTENEAKANTIPLRAENGAYSNPLYKNSAIGDDLYDRPKSHPTADDLYDRPKSHPTADDLYDRPKSHSTDDEDSDDGEAEGTTVQMPSIESRKEIIAEDLYDRPKSHPVNTEFVDNVEMDSGKQNFGSDSGCDIDETADQ